MSFVSMTDNLKNIQSLIDRKSVNKTRKPWRIFCYNCKLYTQSIEPIIIKKNLTVIVLHF